MLAQCRRDRDGTLALQRAVIGAADIGQFLDFEHDVHGTVRAFRHFTQRQRVVAAIGGMHEGKADARIIAAATLQVEAAQIGIAEAQNGFVEFVNGGEGRGRQHNVAHAQVAIVAGDKAAGARLRAERGIVNETTVVDFEGVAVRIGRAHDFIGLAGASFQHIDVFDRTAGNLQGCDGGVKCGLVGKLPTGGDKTVLFALLDPESVGAVIDTEKRDVGIG